MVICRTSNWSAAAVAAGAGGGGGGGGNPGTRKAGMP